MGNQCCSTDFVVRDGFTFRSKPREPLPVEPHFFEPLALSKVFSQHETVNNYFYKSEGNWMLEDESSNNGNENHKTQLEAPCEIVKKQSSQQGSLPCLSDRILNPTFAIDTKILESTRTSDFPFSDADFQPSIDSLCANMQAFPISYEIDWLRVMQFSTQPEIFSSQFRLQPQGIVAGSLNDTYFLSALCSLAEHPAHVTRLFESDTDTNEKGFFSVWLNHDGLWKLVVIDDFFPCSAGQPAFSKSVDANELWVLILEKAYAKLFGSYHRIELGYPEEAIADLTGSPFDMISTTEFGIEATWAYIYEKTKLACGMRSAEQATSQGICWMSIASFCAKYCTVSCNYLHADYLFNSKSIEISSHRTYSIVKMSAKARNSSGYIQFHQKDIRNRETISTTYSMVRMMAFSGHPGEIHAFLGEVSSRSRNAYIPVSLGHARDFFVVISVEGAIGEDCDPFSSELVVSAYTSTEVWFSNDDAEDREYFLSTDVARNQFLDSCFLRVPPMMNPNDEHVYIEDAAIFRYSNTCFGYLYFAYINESTSNVLHESITAILSPHAAIHNDHSNEPFKLQEMKQSQSQQKQELTWNVEVKPQTSCVVKYRLKDNYDLNLSNPSNLTQSTTSQVQFEETLLISLQDPRQIEMKVHSSKVSSSNCNSFLGVTDSCDRVVGEKDAAFIQHILQSCKFSESVGSSGCSSSGGGSRRVRKVKGVEQPVYFYSYTSSEGGMAFYYENQSLQKTFCENLRLTLVNLRFADGSKVPEEVNVVVPPGQGKLLSFKPINPLEKTSFKLDFTSFFQ